MGKKQRRRTEQSEGTTFAHGTRSRWRAPDAATARGKLTKREELLIAQTPVPEKTNKQLQDDLDLRATHTPLSDASVPWELHKRTMVDATGALEFTDAFFRHLGGDLRATVVNPQTTRILAELERSHRVLWAVLVERYQYERSYAEIAAQLFVTDRTVARLCRLATEWVLQRVQERPEDTNARKYS